MVKEETGAKPKETKLSRWRDEHRWSSGTVVFELIVVTARWKTWFHHNYWELKKKKDTHESLNSYSRAGALQDGEQSHENWSSSANSEGHFSLVILDQVCIWLLTCCLNTSETLSDGIRLPMSLLLGSNCTQVQAQPPGPTPRPGPRGGKVQNAIVSSIYDLWLGDTMRVTQTAKSTGCIFPDTKNIKNHFSVVEN